MVVSKNSGTPKSSHFNRVFHYKPSILGYPYFWKHLYTNDLPKSAQHTKQDMEISDLFASPLPCRSRWSSSRRSFASWKNQGPAAKWLGKLKKQTWIQGKLQDQTWKLFIFKIVFVHSRQLNLWYWWGRNPWLTHEISSHFVGFQTGLRPGSKPSWEISLRIVSEDL